MDCADCAISLDTSLAKRLKPTKCWYTTARVIADGLRWLHYLTRHTVSQAIETYEVLIPVSWQRAFLTTALVIASAEYAISLDTSLAEWLIPTKCWYLFLDDCTGDWYWNGLTLLAEWLKPTKCWHTTARVIASAEYAISLDTSLAKLALVIDIGMSLTLLAKRLIPTKCWYLFLDDCKGDWYWNGLTLLAKRLKPTKCWHTTARVIADGLRWLHYLTRHFVSQACKGDWYWNELDTVSQAIDTYEVLTHNRKGDSRWTAMLHFYNALRLCKVYCMWIETDIAESHSTHC